MLFPRLRSEKVTPAGQSTFLNSGLNFLTTCCHLRGTKGLKGLHSIFKSDATYFVVPFPLTHKWNFSISLSRKTKFLSNKNPRVPTSGNKKSNP